jgi:hypothetical protein
VISSDFFWIPECCPGNTVYESLRNLEAVNNIILAGNPQGISLELIIKGERRRVKAYRSWLSGQ